MTDSWHDDQGAAADRETAGLLASMASAAGASRVVALDGAVGLADQVADATRGLPRCRHLRKAAPRPAVARLPLRRVDCEVCCRTPRRPPAGTEELCDWCGTGGVTVWRPLMVQLGSMLVYGDACPACAAEFQLYLLEADL